MNEYETNTAPDPVGAYPHARKAGPFLFLSGVGPRLPGNGEVPGNVFDADGNLVAYDIEAQCRSVFSNVRNILEAAGSRWEDLVDIMVFLTDMQRDFAVFNRLYAEHFTEHRPTRTTIEVGALPTVIAVEMKCIALARQET